MNSVINKFFLIGYEFMSVMYLKQPRFTNNVCMSFTKTWKTYGKFEETKDSWYSYQMNEIK